MGVAKKGSELWKALAAKEKEVYEIKAKQKKEAYDAFVATPEGAAALKAYKEATAAVAYKEMDASEDNVEVEAAASKNKADLLADGVENAKKKQKIAKAGA